MDDTTHDDDETDAGIAYENAIDAKAAKQDEAAIQGWGDFKVRPWGFPKPVNTLFAHTRLTLFVTIKGTPTARVTPSRRVTCRTSRTWLTCT